MKSSIPAVLPFLLITVSCILFVELFYYVVERYVLITDVPALGEMKTDVTTNNSIHDLPKNSILDSSIILQRNLFGPPPKKTDNIQVDKSAEDIPPTKGTDFVLMGTVLGPDQKNRAVILYKKSREQDLYMVGDYIQGALVKDIKRGRILLDIDGSLQTLDMSEASKYGRPTAGKVSPSSAQKKIRPRVVPGRQRAVVRPLQGQQGVEPVPRSEDQSNQMGTETLPQPD